MLDVCQELAVRDSVGPAQDPGEHGGRKVSLGQASQTLEISLKHWAAAPKVIGVKSNFSG